MSSGVVRQKPTFLAQHPADIVQWCRIRYHVFVSNAKKILEGMRRNARNWRIEDLKVVARRFGWTLTVRVAQAT